jgi:hypothetical protein
VRFVILLFALAFGPMAGAAGLAGTYVLDGPGGRLTIRFEVKGNALTGAMETGGRYVVDFAGTAQGTTAKGTVTSKEGMGTFEASVEGDLLNVVLAQPAGPNQQAATLPLQLQRESASKGAAARSPGASGGDPRLVGQWVSQSVITSGTASMASEEFLAFAADGNYTFGTGRAVASGTDWSYDGGAGDATERGQWRARDGVLFLLAASGQWTRLGKYGMTDDGTTMRITYDRGGRKLWSRR